MRWNEVLALIQKDARQEWRQNSLLTGLVLYLAASVFVINISLNEMKADTWITLYWIILLFSAVSTVAKSFMQEGRGRWLYYYTLAHPASVMLAKIIYNIILMLLMSAIGLSLFMLWNGNPVKHAGYFYFIAMLGSISFAMAFTIMSAVASRAGHNPALMAILSLPFFIPSLLLLIKLSRLALLNHIEYFPWDDISLLLLLDAIMLLLSMILFPYLWRE